MPQLSLHSPVGDLTLSEEDGALVSVDWGWGRDQSQTPLLREARDQLDAYFDGKLTRFDLPVSVRSTPYRLRVWQALAEIPYGEIRRYADIAHAAGGSARAAGQACGANHLPILIPCHRVLAATGLGGFSGGEGAATKRALLALENRYAGPMRSGALPLLAPAG